jgi:hypothetical protein
MKKCAGVSLQVSIGLMDGVPWQGIVVLHVLCIRKGCVRIISRRLVHLRGYRLHGVAFIVVIGIEAFAILLLIVRKKLRHVSP